MPRQKEVIKPNADIIKQIKALPDGAKLTAKQIAELRKNVDAILQITLPEKAASGNLQWVIDLFKRDPRFRFLDQVPGAIDRIEEALRKYGGTLK